MNHNHINLFDTSEQTRAFGSYCQPSTIFSPWLGNDRKSEPNTGSAEERVA